MAAGANITIYSNDGSVILVNKASANDLENSTTVTENGLYDSVFGTIYTYSGNKNFIGISTSPNATVPTYSIGQSFTADLGSEFYIVEETKSPVTITYNGETITEIKSSGSKTLYTNGKICESDIVVEYEAPTVIQTTQATPSISVSSDGLITASATQTEGYVTAGTKSATRQLTTKAAETITPTTSQQTAVASGVYTTGVITVAAIQTETKDITTNGTFVPTIGKYFNIVTVEIPEYDGSVV